MFRTEFKPANMKTTPKIEQLQCQVKCVRHEMSKHTQQQQKERLVGCWIKWRKGTGGLELMGIDLPTTANPPTGDHHR